MDNEELDEIVNDEISKEETQKIVPSYAKKENLESAGDKKNKKEKGKKIKKEKNINGKRKNTSLISKILMIIISLFLVSGVIFLVWYLTKPDYEKYRPYEEKMNTYGFNTMYDNSSALTEEKVTKSEAIKMITSTMLNTTDILKMAKKSEKTFPNADYVDYAIVSGIIAEDEINEKNADDIVKYGDLITYIENAKKILLEEEVKTDVEVKAKNFKNIPSDKQILIADLVSNEIIPNDTKRINLNQKVFKGMLNEILVNVAEKFNTITIGESKLNINPDKIPSNVNEYPYILSNVDKKVYEYEFIKFDEETFLNPKQTYLEKRDFFSSIQYEIEDYYNLILNIDYETIDEQTFYENLSKHLVMLIEEEEVKEYVDYVKENRIKIKGNVKAQMPAVYFDGEYYRVRTKIEFEVLNSNTQLNLVMFDWYQRENYQYKNDKYELIVDTAMVTPYKHDSLFIYPASFVPSIISENSGIE